MSEVFVTKTTLINLLGDAAIPFAMFMAGDTIQGKAVKILFENIDQLDLNCAMVQNQMIPLLKQVGVIGVAEEAAIVHYIQESLA